MILSLSWKTTARTVAKHSAGVRRSGVTLSRSWKTIAQTVARHSAKRHSKKESRSCTQNVARLERRDTRERNSLATMLYKMLFGGEHSTLRKHVHEVVANERWRTVTADQINLNETMLGVELDRVVPGIAKLVTPFCR